MDSQTIRTVLGKLQGEPDTEASWSALRSAVKQDGGDLSSDELQRLLVAARERHAARGEWEAVAQLLDIAVATAAGGPGEIAVLREQAEVLKDRLYDDESAAVTCLRIVELDPNDRAASTAIDELEEKRGRSAELAQKYLDELAAATDDTYRSSLLMHAAEMDVRFGTEGADLSMAVERLEQAVRLDPANERAAELLELVHRRAGHWDEVARVLERLADRAENPAERVAAGVRLARVQSQHLSDQERAARAYEGVLRTSPSYPEAMDFLTSFYSSHERWAELVALYERELGAKKLNETELVGDMLQIAMLYWKKLEHARAADPWFTRIAKVEPANEAMLAFYREYCTSLGDDGRLMDVLGAAQRSLKDGSKEKAAIAAELGRLAEGQANAQKAIEQYKAVLRNDPDNAEAREKLKGFYKQTQSHNALVELLRQQLERLPADAYQARLGVLREVATIYREYIKNDTALLSVLNQIVQLDDKLDEHDAGEMREIVALYDRLGRARDMITYQLKLAEITPDVEEKKQLYRAAGRRWLEQFSNAQNAADAFAALLKLEPGDREARERLEELYRKRRAWSHLYDLFKLEHDDAQGPTRAALGLEMAQLASERLNRGDDAVRLYREILAADAGRLDVLDALERHSERAKDWSSLADALERRAEVLTDDGARLVVLQKLGTVYADHLNDPKAAAKAWRRVLELQPGHQRALRVLRDACLATGDYDGLTELYATQGDFEGLAEVLSTAADRAKDAAVKIDLSYRAAAVFESRLQQPERAFRSYERVLSTDPNDTRAVRALIPLYEKDEKWGRLPALYEQLVERAATVDEKLELLARLVEISGKQLSDRRAAAAYARRAYELAPDSPVALDILEDASRAAGSWESFVEAIEARLTTLESAPADPPAPAAETPAAPAKKKKKKKGGGEEPSQVQASPSAAPAGDLRRTLELKLARVFAEELARPDDAIKTYQTLLERDATDQDAALALDRILRQLDRRDELRNLFDLRVKTAASPSDKLALLREWAVLEEEAFDAPERAVALYRRELEIDPTDADALVTLARLLLSLDDAAGATAVMEQRREQLTGEERAESQVALAELYLGKLERPLDALASAVDALPYPASSARAIGVLERLLEVKAARARAAEVLAERYAESGDGRGEARTLAILLDETEGAKARLPLELRLSEVHEKKLGSFGKALDVMLGALRESPEEIGLWERAEALATEAGRPTDLAEVYREVLRGKLPPEVEVELCDRASHLHEDRLGDPIGATPYLERVLALRPGNETAFRRLKDILTAAERWPELEALYDRAVEASDDPVRKVEMLAEVALVCEEIIEDAVKATRHYERILAIDPYHETAVRALDRLYTRAGKDSELAALLERRLETAVGEDSLDLKLRLSRLQLDLHQPDKAIAHVEDVLRERVNDPDAKKLAERLLEIGSLRVRAARILEVVYETRDEVRDLARVLATRLDADTEATPDETRELLRRIAVLRNERLRDDSAALDAYARLVPLDPSDGEARDRLVEIGSRLDAYARVAEVLSEAAAATSAVNLKGEILTRVAVLYEERLGDRARAETVYRRVLELDPNDPRLSLPAARSLERLYIALGDNKELAEMLRIEIRLEDSASVRGELLARLGELSETVLGDSDGAISAWRSRLDDIPDDDLALSALDRLYQKTERHRDLVDVLRRRRDLSNDGDTRRTLLSRSAEVLWKQLDAGPEAIDEYQTLIDEFGPTSPALEALESLFAAAESWDNLADTYSRHLEVADNDVVRLELLAKLGDLERERRKDVPAAIDVYRRALTIDTRHAPSRTALESLLASDDAPTRREVAQILRPLYEAEGENEKLLHALEIEVLATEDAIEKLHLLETAMKVAGGPLGDANRAFDYAVRAVRQAVGHVDLEPWFANLERLASATGRQADYVKLLCDVVGGIFDGELQLGVMLKIARIARLELRDTTLAREYYNKALELRADEPQALEALEALYEEAGDAQHLLEVLERRAEVAPSDDERKRLLYRRAKLLSGVLDDKRRAIEVYESILELGLEDEALLALEGLYTSVERWQDLLALYERQVDARRGDLGNLRVKIAGVASRRLGDADRAFEELEHALGADRRHEGAILELERLLGEAKQPEQRARAAELLEPVYLARADWPRVRGVLEARLEVATDPDARRDLLTRLAQLYEEQQEDYRSALETTAKLFHEDLSDAKTMAELERLARVAGAEQRLAEIYAHELEQATSDDHTTAKLARRTGELFDQIGQPPRALAFYRRSLEFEPDSKSLFDAIDKILVREQLHEDRVKLHRQALEHRFEPAERLALLHTIALLERRELGRPDEAIETYRAAVEVDDRDAVALDALVELYRERERWDDLAELYLRRAELADRPEQGIVYRLALARLYLKLEQAERAVDQLEEIVRIDPRHVEATAELDALRQTSGLKERVVEILRPLYQAADDWRRLVQLNEDRFALASDSEKVAVLRETAELWERRGNDKKRARRANGTALRLDPEDGEVRAEYERLAAETQAWDELATTYQEIIADHPDLTSARDYFAVLARVHDKERDDPRRALWAYDQLYASDPSDASTLDAMERLATLLSDWPALVSVLSAKAEVVLDDEERASLLRRVGEVKRDVLDDRAGAIAAYSRASELDPTSAFTVDCLIELYEAEGDAARLVELYERRVELSGEDDGELKHGLLVAAAKCYETKLDDRPRAIDALVRALQAKPGDGAVLASLDRLYRAEELWSELLDNLRAQVGLAQTAPERAALHKAMGAVLAEKLSSYDEALEEYRRALDEEPSDVEAVERAVALGESHEDLRRRAAEILVPVLRNTERWEKLVAVLELRLTAESEAAERTQTLWAIAEVLEGKLGKPAEAETVLLRALTERPEAEDLHAEIARLAEAGGSWERYADALSERAVATFEPEVARELYVRLGAVADERLGDKKRAIDAYEKAVEQAGDQPELLAALDRLYVATKELDKVADVLERRVGVEFDGELQAGLFHRLAELQVDHLGDPARALGSLRSALERVPAHAASVTLLERLAGERDLFEEAAEILEGVYRAQSSTEKLAGLYEKRVAFAEGVEARSEMRQRLAQVLEQEARDPARGQAVLEQGLAEAPGDPMLLDEIERLATATGGWVNAANALKSAIEQHRDGIAPDLACSLSLRLARWLRDRAKDPAAAEAALVRGLEFDPVNDEILEQLEDLQRGSGRARDLVETLRRRAKLSADEERRAEFYRQAKVLADGLGDRGLSETLLRELLEQDDTNRWALSELATLSEASGNYKEAFALFVRQSEVESDASEVRRLRRQAAVTARDRLNDPTRAIELFEQLFEDDPSDLDAAAALRALLASSERLQELGRLLERLVDLSDSPEKRSELRLELAKLNAEKFGSTDTAIDLVRAVLEDDPGRADAVVVLSELYEKTQRDEELAELLSSQIDAARARGDAQAELRFQVRLGEIYETRLNDRARAIETYQSVLERDPSHRGALECVARLSASEGRLEQAAAALDRLLATSHGAEAVRLALSLADVEEQLGSKEKAAGALERGLAADERQQDLRERLRKLYEATSTWDKLAGLIARDAELVSGADQQVKLLRQAAQIQAQKRGDHAAAAALLDRASQIKPDDRELLLALCDEYNASGRGKAAAEVLEKIVQSYGAKRTKELAEIHRRLASAYLADGNGQRALEELDKAFRIEPGNVAVLALLGEVALNVGDLKKAQQMYRALLLQKLDDGGPIKKALVFVRLGDIHDKLGEKPKAVQMYERALQTDATLDEAKTKLAAAKA
ncbi:MAG TPA: tetratricopeptide repeat protein [Polyangiaceae bacterium]|nr:tetratricopeptide repeat protein [Polyangiaceae bacterium]